MPKSFANAGRLVAAARKRQNVSVRGLARRVGLRSHAGLSAFLRGRGNLSEVTVYKLLTALDFTDAEQVEILAGLVPPAIRRHIGNPRTPTPEAPLPRVVAASDVASPALLDGAALHPKIAWVFEVCRLLRKAPASQIFAAFSRFGKVTQEELETCIAQLKAMQLLTPVGSKLQASVGCVRVSSNARFRRLHMGPMVRQMLKTFAHAASTEPESVFLRMACHSVRARTTDDLKRRIEDATKVFFQILADQEGPDDNCVFSVIVGGIEIARIPPDPAAD